MSFKIHTEELKMISRTRYTELRKMLKVAGFEQEYSVLAGSASGSVYSHADGRVFQWNPKTTEQDVLAVING